MSLALITCSAEVASVAGGEFYTSDVPNAFDLEHCHNWVSLQVCSGEGSLEKHILQSPSLYLPLIRVMSCEVSSEFCNLSVCYKSWKHWFSYVTLSNKISFGATIPYPPFWYHRAPLILSFWTENTLVCKASHRSSHYDTLLKNHITQGSTLLMAVHGKQATQSPAGFRKPLPPNIFALFITSNRGDLTALWSDGLHHWLIQGSILFAFILRPKSNSLILSKIFF